SSAAQKPPGRKAQAARQAGANGGGGRRLHEVTARGAFIQIRSHVSPSRGGVRTEANLMRRGPTTRTAVVVSTLLFYQIFRQRFQVQAVALGLVRHAER